MESIVFDNPDLLKVWIWCLLKATHKEHEQMVGLQVQQLEEGQFIFGRIKAAEQLKMTESKVYRLIKTLEKLGNLNIKSNNKYSIVTIEKWGDYQSKDNDNEQQTEQQMNNKRTTNEQQMNTNKNVKNDKNDKKYIIYAEFVKMTEKEYNTLVEKHGEELTNKMIEVLDNYKGSKGKKYKSDYRAILSWVEDKVLKENGNGNSSRNAKATDGQDTWDIEHLITRG